MNSEQPVVVRFAPSPTGSLHVGGARTALFNALLHIRRGGKFIFRIEDTDRNREVTGAAENMFNDLKWLGIEFTEGELIGGEFSPYRQSKRADYYRKAAEQLIANSTAYRCFCPPEKIERQRIENNLAGRPPRYDKTCRNLTTTEISDNLNSGIPFVVRLSVDNRKSIEIDDLVKGSVTFDSKNLDDLILVRSDGTPTGVLAGAVDDHTMGVTHIFRGDEWLPSTPYQYLIFKGLDGKIPHWGHLSLLVDENHAKLSKRTAGLSIAELREEGFLPEAIRRYLAGLGRSTIPQGFGWTLDELAENFDPAGYRSGEIVYSKEVLTAENQKFLHSMPTNTVTSRFKNWCDSYLPLNLLDDTRQELAMKLAVETSSTFRDCKENLDILLKQPNLERGMESDFPKASSVIATLTSNLETLNWDAASIQDAIAKTGKLLSIKGRDLYHPIRFALTGQAHGPKLGDVMALLGKEETINRLEFFLNFYLSQK